MDRENLRLLLASGSALGPDALYDLSLEALDNGLADDVCRRLATALVSYPADHRLWQALGLGYRSLLDAAAAHDAFRRAAELAPTDPLIAHSVARTAMEAGQPSSRLYSRARRLAPSNGDVLLGEAVAIRADGDKDAALKQLSTVLLANPGWLQGHTGYARLAAASRRGEDATSTIDVALQRFPRDQALFRCKYSIQITMRDYNGARTTAEQAAALFGADSSWTRMVAECLTESGNAAEAQRLFDRLPDPQHARELVHPIRTLIRLQRYDAATKLAERQFKLDDEKELWPYRSLLWRLQDDRRWEWLEGDDRLVATYDLSGIIADMNELTETLRAIHAKSGEMFDQSVRGGTQTDGHLLARGEPALQRLRATLAEAVADHVAQLPAPVAGHPTLIERRAPLRFAGAWSIRLKGRGFHVDHVHPQGWFSSAFYVTVPSTQSDDATASDKPGWLTLGECRDLIPALEGFRSVQPKPGLLVLFPSTMWHGTRPFAEGERMSVAFDITCAEPRS